jgi:hypothetical protein
MDDPRILSLDLALRAGWAMGRVLDRTPTFGSVRLAAPGASMGAIFANCRKWLSTFDGVDIAVFESPMQPSFMSGHTNATTIRILMGIAAIAEEHFFSRGVDVREAQVREVRRHFLGSNKHKRVAAKALTISACRRLGWNPPDDNAADALALWHFQASVIEPKLALQTSPLFRRSL